MEFYRYFRQTLKFARDFECFKEFEFLKRMGLLKVGMSVFYCNVDINMRSYGLTRRERLWLSKDREKGGGL